MPTSKTRPILTSLLALGLLASGCKDEPEPVAKPRGEGATAEREWVVPGTARVVDADDPDADGWETEQWSAEIARELKALGKALMAGNGWEDKANAMAAADFEGATLLPATRSEEAVSDLLVVAEAEGLIPESKPFADALAAMLAEAGIVGSPHRAATKVVSIQRDGDGPLESAVLFHFAGVGADGERCQLDGEWQTKWTLREDGNGVALVSVAGAGRRTISRLGGFSDVTHAALGQVPSFPSQFYRGQDHWSARIEMLTGLDVGGWQGLALADVNGDGWDDIYVAQPGGLPNRLFVAKGDGTYTERAGAAGVDFLDSSHANLFVDLDNDGDQDLLAGVSHGIVVMENDGAGNFKIRGTKLLPAAIPYSIAAADIDVDGDLDFYVCCYNRRPGVNRHHVFARPVPYHDANNGGRNAMFRNGGGWQFNDVTVSCGMNVNNRRFSYAAAWEDYDNDGDLDLYVANDFGRNNLYRNDTEAGSAPHFEEVAERAGVVDIGPGMSACWGDYDDDGARTCT